MSTKFNRTNVCCELKAVLRCKIKAFHKKERNVEMDLAQKKPSFFFLHQNQRGGALFSSSDPSGLLQAEWGNFTESLINIQTPSYASPGHSVANVRSLVQDDPKISLTLRLMTKHWAASKMGRLQSCSLSWRRKQEDKNNLEGILTYSISVAVKRVAGTPPHEWETYGLRWRILETWKIQRS